MQKYEYTAWAVDNHKALKSTCYALSEGVVRSQLKRIGYTVDMIRPSKVSQLFSQRKRIKTQDLVSMCRRFSAMYSAGVSLMDCLSLLAEENDSQGLTEILNDIHDRIGRGTTITDAFSKYRDVFPAFFVNMLRAGEMAGKLDYVLEHSAAYMDKQYDLRRKIRQAFAYPMVVLFMIVAVVTLMMIFVVPIFSDVYTRLGVELPGITKALMLISDKALYIFPSLAGLGVGLWLTYRNLKRNPTARRRIDKIKLSIPLMGTVFHHILLLRFIRTLCLTMKAGLELPEAIAIAEDVADNAVVSESVDIIQRNVERGGTITEAVQLHAFFPKSIAHAFATGEEAGNLADILDKFADGIDQEIDDGIKRLLTKIEPALIMLLTFVVGFIAMAIYLPIFDLMTALQK